MDNESVYHGATKSMVFLLMKYALLREQEDDNKMAGYLFEELHAWFSTIEKSHDPDVDESIRNFIRSELIGGSYGSKANFLSDLESLFNLFKVDGKESKLFEMFSDQLEDLYRVCSDPIETVADHVVCGHCGSILFLRVDAETCTECLTTDSLGYPNGNPEGSDRIKVPEGIVVQWVNKDFLS